MSKQPSLPKTFRYTSREHFARVMMRLADGVGRFLAQEAHYPMYHKLNLSKSFFPWTIVIVPFDARQTEHFD